MTAFDVRIDRSGSQRQGCAPLIVGIGGSVRASSTTERLLRAALAEVERAGGRTLLLDGQALDLPVYAPHRPERHERARTLVEALRIADGILVGSPGYHGTISGHVKNALDYIEDLSGDPRPYLEGRAVGCLAAAAGWQASVTTLSGLRSVVHALRGWPTPIGIAVNSLEPVFTETGEIARAQLQQALETMARQVVHFAHLQHLSAAS